MKVYNLVATLVLGSLVLLMSQPGYALRRTHDIPSIYSEIQYGMATNLSVLLENHDMGSQLRYAVGTYAGHDGQIAFHLLGTMENVKFSLNDSSFQAHWQDTRINYFWGPAYIMLMLTRVDVKASLEGQDTLDAAGSGFGYGLGWHQSLGPGSLLYLDLAQANLANMKNAEDSELQIPSRLEIDLGARVRVWKTWLDMVFGYRLSSVSYAGDFSATDRTYTTYVGLRTSVVF